MSVYENVAWLRESLLKTRVNCQKIVVMYRSPYRLPILLSVVVVVVTGSSALGTATGVTMGAASPPWSLAACECVSIICVYVSAATIEN